MGFFQKHNAVCAIEIGTSKICVLIGDVDPRGGIGAVLGQGVVASGGSVIKGEIVDMDRCAGLLGKALEAADRSSGGELTNCRLITLLVIAMYWALILSGGIGEFWRYVLAIRTDNMEYRFSLLVAAFSNVKYILVLVIAILMLLPYFKSWRHMYRTLSEKKLTVLNMIWLFALLGFFLFSILFFLPQYPQYSFAPYMYLKL